MESPDAGSDSFEWRPVEWTVAVRKARREVLESQKFRLLKHADARISLRDRNGLHLDVAGNRSEMKGGVTAQGVLVASPIAETGKFTVQYNDDKTVSLKQSNNMCLTSSTAGLVLVDCGANGGAGSAFTPTVLESEGVVAFKTRAGAYLTVYEAWVQNYKTALVMVNETVARQSPSQCAEFRRSSAGPGGLVTLETRGGAYLTAAGGETLGADAAEAGPAEMFREVKSDDGGVSLRAPLSAEGATNPPAAAPPGRLRGDARSRLFGRLEGLRASSHVPSAADIFDLRVNSDSTVSLTSDGLYVCAAERVVTVATCETRKASASWPMQGVNNSMTIQNVCAHEEWYGFKTKVDAYRKFVGELVHSDDPGQIVVLVDNSDMAFGGCRYHELLDRYDLIRNLTGAIVIAGADTSPFPTTDWPYDSLEDRREVIMQSFGMNLDSYCNVTGCPEYSYRYANSGFLMGPPLVLYDLLGCMLDKGQGHFGGDPGYEYDDQHGLQACMFEGGYHDIVVLDYSGTLTMELIRVEDSALYQDSGRVYNRVARDMSQCFVHGNGETLESWWPRLFPGAHMTEIYGKTSPEAHMAEIYGKSSAV